MGVEIGIVPQKFRPTTYLGEDTLLEYESYVSCELKLLGGVLLLGLLKLVRQTLAVKAPHSVQWLGVSVD